MGDVSILLLITCYDKSEFNSLLTYITSIAGGMSIVTNGYEIEVSAQNNTLIIAMAEKLKVLNIIFSPKFIEV